MKLSVFRALRSVIVCGVAAVALVSCGGGGSSEPAAIPTGDESAQAQNIGSGATAGVQLNVSSMTLQSSTRINRTIWQYVYQVSVTNTGEPVSGATFTLQGVGEGTTIISGTFNSGPIPSGAAVIGGTITIQQDRNIPFSTSGWVWTQTGVRKSVPKQAAEQLQIPGATLNIESGVLSETSEISLNVTQDPKVSTQYEESDFVVSPSTVRDPSEYIVKIDKNSLPDDKYIALTIKLNDQLLGFVKSGASIYASTLTIYSSDDSESGESNSSVDILSSAVDLVNGTIIVQIPGTVFYNESSDESEQVTIKILADTTSADASSIAPELQNAISPTGSTKALAQSLKTSSCTCASGRKGAFGMCFPLGGDSVNDLLTSPLKTDAKNHLVIIAPFNEPDHGTKKKPHPHYGIDFRADSGMDVYSAATGYIEIIRNSKNAGVYINVRHFDGSYSRYLHLNGVVLNGNTIPAEKVEVWTQKTGGCQVPKYPVLAGAVIAKSGTTPNVPAHLHFEYYKAKPGQSGLTTINPIFSLGTPILYDELQKVAPNGELQNVAPNVRLFGILSSPTGDSSIGGFLAGQAYGVRVAVNDSNNSEIKVLRMKAITRVDTGNGRTVSNEVILPVAAQGSNFGTGNAINYWPIVSVKWNFDSDINSANLKAGSLIWPTFTLISYPHHTEYGVYTDSGVVRLATSGLPDTPTVVPVSVTLTPVKLAIRAPVGGRSLGIASGATTNAPTVAQGFDEFAQTLKTNVYLSRPIMHAYPTAVSVSAGSKTAVSVWETDDKGQYTFNASSNIGNSLVWSVEGRGIAVDSQGNITAAKDASGSALLNVYDPLYNNRITIPVAIIPVANNN